jgi:hypothetical protein
MRKNKAKMLNQDERIWELASRFETEEEIAKEVGLDRSQVNRSINRTAARLAADKSGLDAMRESLKARLDQIMSETYRAWVSAQGDRPAPNNTRYLDVNLKAMERLCRLLGLDNSSDATINVTIDPKGLADKLKQIEGEEV